MKFITAVIAVAASAIGANAAEACVEDKCYDCTLFAQTDAEAMAEVENMQYDTIRERIAALCAMQTENIVEEQNYLPRFQQTYDAMVPGQVGPGPMYDDESRYMTMDRDGETVNPNAFGPLPYDNSQYQTPEPRNPDEPIPVYAQQGPESYSANVYNGHKELKSTSYKTNPYTPHVAASTRGPNFDYAVNSYNPHTEKFGPHEHEAKISCEADVKAAMEALKYDV